MTNAPADILSAWIALEVLSPPTFERPDRLAGDGLSSVAKLSGSRLPWEGEGERSRKNYRLYYQIILGSVAMPASVERLVEVYGDTRQDAKRVKGEAVLAIVVVDAKGRLIDDAPPAVSSFAWGLPIALEGDLVALGAWREHEQRLSNALVAKFSHTDEDGQPLPVTRRQIDNAFEWLMRELGLDVSLVTAPHFAVRSYQYFKAVDPPETVLLNSFYLADLADARSAFAEGRAPDTLIRYLGVHKHSEQRDLLRDNGAVARAVAPLNFPPAKWPANGRHALSLLQQVAVNLSDPVTRSSQILAVNGPPGTGKTTLLRDIVAAQVCERAKAMCAFDNPEDAFRHSQLRIKTGQAWTHLYTLPDSLRGFEMVVASTNNKAVENVTAELPTQHSVAADSGLRYFKALSDNLLEQDTWGAIAAVLGNASNRSRFRQRFWWDEDFGLMTYLANASGSRRWFEKKDEDGNVIERRLPKVVDEDDAPVDHKQALTRWKTARAKFQEALRRSENAATEAETIRKSLHAYPVARARVRAFEDAKGRLDRVIGHWSTRPGFFSRLFRTRKFRTWQEALVSHIASYEQARKDAKPDAPDTLRVSENSPRDLAMIKDKLERAFSEATREASELERILRAGYARLGRRIVDQAFFDLPTGQRQQVSPWFDEAGQRARDDVFVAAVQLHKAFVDASAKPLRNNLNAFLSSLGGRSLGTAERDALLPHLWSSLFLVVPVISTTFASVERMFGTIGQKTLGWLLIDEAGQAAPQAAVGALLRSKRAVVVGDPMQIEPVVMLPETLTSAICRQFGVAPEIYDAPSASVQTLADAATPYCADFASREGTRTVGVPLLVHRRCAEPMFSVSNSVAYEGLMVSATPKRKSPIGEVLGPSRWIHVEGDDLERWCPEEGRIVVAMLSRLKAANVPPDLYVVTPFVRVADGLRRSILDSGILENWIEGETWRWVYDRVGTVHTVQGREAEAVMFVLGAQAPGRAGARYWAGGKPNIINVAVTRAQERLYVIGNRGLWQDAGHFRSLRGLA